ncbi:anti-sigma factor [Pseudomonas gingeri NCPPB 3146 = LMG 5327]|uniref:Zf-HC2 domain-containing protein n=2 Tax=Pseudomonas gingeri TaxID=117681 RepID=A0A7Y7Y732_9PSED|nr:MULTISPECIES: zf-HC2 domain-containing protein [Pseudomonas]NVZ30236.1 zf-HC2 domain-containing protein [Pseudomonas gingeri]NVZ63741.1 zf-HC2 domain-containing protein [Pseudomonas gingeri]NVZ74508.1 zf-HC2 domain-containing protein [Pseudomonas gingeri]NWA10467.1 zf-HC2 domain-containing protein [Pseudomonas gingeri]NWC18518.1 zf-HC2 domain-containing protein [Pseudomonas gingeri]
MLTCKEQVARSSDYLDGQLSFRERLMVRHHLMFCPNCRRFIRQMRLMQGVLRKMPEPPVENLDALARQLSAEQQNAEKP